MLPRYIPSELKGKQIFYNASDQGGKNGANRMSAEGYTSCATCHIEGMHDGRTWDFTGRGEGLRNTTDLRGRSGTGHGKVHWSANFDEIQDFENDIRLAFRGAGFLSDSDFEASKDSLGGVIKAGLNKDLDALADYVTSLGDESLPKSPFRNKDGTLTKSGKKGEKLFKKLNCTTCHIIPKFTDSTLIETTLHDIGTMKESSGKRRNEILSGIDTPTLLSVFSSQS